MKTRRIIQVEPGRAELQEAELDEGLEPLQALVKTEYSVISAGTEGAGFTGLIKEMSSGSRHYPRQVGACNLGEVVAVGSEVTACVPGDRVLSFSPHASLVKAKTAHLAQPVPKDADGQKLVLARMAGISFSAVNSSTLHVGDTVLVIGMGLVGNLAAQLFQIAGAEVMAADLSDFRLEKARACGIRHTINSAKSDFKTVVMDRTGGKGAHVVVEAVGHSELVRDAVMLTRPQGQVILLGSPRARASFDVTPMLLRIHADAIRLIGSNEWNWPMCETQRVRSMAENYRHTVSQIMDGRLNVAPLITDVLSPTHCQLAYEKLTQQKDACLGVVFDWNQL